jgi:hypothetical protein
MKYLILAALVLGNLPAVVFAACVINTSNLHFNDTSGTARVEAMLKDKGYQVVSEENAASDYDLEVRYYGNGSDKTLHMMVWSGYPKEVFNKSIDYKTPFGIEGGVFERRQVVRLSKQIPTCP